MMMKQYLQVTKPGIIFGNLISVIGGFLLASKGSLDVPLFILTMVGGATLTGLLGTSAWYAPGASVAYLVDSILNDQKKMIPCSVLLEGEYGQSDICLGVPCIIGKNGIEEILDIQLNDAEKALFAKSADAVRAMNGDLKAVLG
jgi:malate dehydrogenase